jgi:hypothetical protein
MYFAESKQLKQFNCDQCSDIVKRQRNCQEDGFENLKILKQTDEHGIKVNFCPGKATWFESMLRLFNDCKVAIHTGLLPKSGGLENQSALFTDTFSFFVERWVYRSKIRLWTDIHEFTGKVFESIGKMFGSK